MSEQVGVPSLRPGDRIAGYRIDGVVGRGGMGLVYRALDDRLKRTVAIKVIAPEFAADSKFRTRFEQESLVAAQIEHPNVIPVYQVGESEGLLYIVMRYVEGVDLRQLLGREERFEPRRAAWIVNQVAAALDAAHARGLVHRDVKPGNVLVAGAGDSEHVYLTDFGITKRIGDTQGLTATGQFVGTVDYVAPEQILGGAVDARSDVYALGCVLYQLVTGVVPFPRNADVAALIAHVNESAPPPRQIVPGLPHELESVITKAMAKNPDERYLSAGDLGRAAIAGAQSREYADAPRSVATGAAATRPPADLTARAGETMTASAEGRDEQQPTAIAATDTAAVATATSDPAPIESSQRPRRPPRRAPALILVAAAAVLAAALAALLIPGSGSKHPPSAPPAKATAALASVPWRSLPPLPNPVQGAGVAPYHGMIWVVGGSRAGHSDLTDVYAYDPQRQRWLTAKDGVPQLPAARAHPALVAAGDQLYAIGGFHPPDGAVATVFRLDSPDGKWAADVRALPAPRGAGAAAYDGNRIVFGGGFGSGAPSSEVWALTADGWASIGRLQQPREHLAAATDGRGTVWFIAGKNGMGSATGLVDVVVQSSVRPGPPIDAVTGATAAGVASGFCAIAGQTKPPDPTLLTGDVQCRQTNARFPAIDPRNYAGAAVLADKLYVVGGYDRRNHSGSRFAEVHDITGTP